MQFSQFIVRRNDEIQIIKSRHRDDLTELNRVVHNATACGIEDAAAADNHSFFFLQSVGNGARADCM